MGNLNNIYYAEGDPDYGGQYISARTSKEARQIALGLDAAQHLNNPFIELRVTRCWGCKEHPDFKGELNIEQIIRYGLAWWDCPECGMQEFRYLYDDKYECKLCEKEFEIPFI